MGFIEVLLIGIALSMDAFAVTISNSMGMPGLPWRRKILFPIAFGAFQFLMPVAGYFVGSLFAGYIEAVAGVFTFVVLAALGINMAREGIKDLRQVADEGSRPEEMRFTAGLVLLQAVATSIDALGVGVSFAGYADLDIFAASTMIGCTTFLICLVALELGRRLGLRFGPKAQVAGGIVLVIIGIRALL